MIKKGAKLCEGVDDILSDFEYLFPAKALMPSPGAPRPALAVELSSAEQSLLALLQMGEELSIDELIQRSGVPASAASVALLGLELKRLAKQVPGKRFVRVRS